MEYPVDGYPTTPSEWAMHIRQVFARNLRRLRHERGLPQEALADQVEINRTYVSDLERGVYAASIDMVDKIGRELGVEAADLLRR